MISVFFLQDISLSSVNEYIISASSHCSDIIMTFIQIASWMSYGRMVQCQKIYILCFVSTKYISFVTEYVISTAVQCSDVDLIQFQKIYILCLFRQNISLLSPNTSFLWQCNAAMLIRVFCLYSLNGYDSVSEDLYFVFRFDQIYLFCHLKDQFTSLHCSDVESYYVTAYINTPRYISP